MEAEDDYYFSSGLSKSDVDLRGADGKVTSVTRKSSTLIVYITLDSLDGSDSGYDLDVYGLEWMNPTAWPRGRTAGTRGNTR